MQEHLSRGLCVGIKEFAYLPVNVNVPGPDLHKQKHNRN